MGDGPMATACVGQSRTRKISTVESQAGRGTCGDTIRYTLWHWADFRESFYESCGVRPKGRKSTKVAGEASFASSLRLQYCTGEQNVAFPGSKTANSLKNRALHAPGSRTHTSKIRIFA